MSSPTRPLPPHGSRPPLQKPSLRYRLLLLLGLQMPCLQHVPGHCHPGSVRLETGPGDLHALLVSRQQGTQKPPNCGLEGNAATSRTCSRYQAPGSLQRTFDEEAPQALSPARVTCPHHPAGSGSSRRHGEDHAGKCQPGEGRRKCPWVKHTRASRGRAARGERESRGPERGRASESRLEPRGAAEGCRPFVLLRHEG